MVISKAVVSLLIASVGSVLLGTSRPWRCDWTDYDSASGHFLYFYDEDCYRMEWAMWSSGVTLLCFGGELWGERVLSFDLVPSSCCLSVKKLKKQCSGFVKQLKSRT